MAKSKSPKDKVAHRTSIKAVKRSEKRADTHEQGTTVPGQEYQPTANELIIYRRNLPHWRLRGAAYFVTWRKHKNQDDLQPGERDVVVDALRHFDGKRYELTGYVVMNDHVHLIVWPEDGYVLEDLCHSWKSFTAHEFQHKFGRIGSVWQDESFDRIIRNEGEYYGKLMYIRNNPRKRWPDIKHYKWVWVKGM